MEFADLDQKDKRYTNGKIAQFMDAYIRQNKVWTPEQMLESFIENQEEQIKKGYFNKDYDGEKEIWNSEFADRWLLTTDGKSFALARMTKKYDKDKPIAKANSPIVERVRFGHYWDNTNYYDISYGLKGGHNFIETEELKKYPHKPWTISHVEQKLNELYKSTLPQVLEKLSASPIEKMFYMHWLDHFYDNKNNPALIPEVGGFRAKFWYYEYEGLAYATHNDLPPTDDPDDIKPKNFRFDFFVSNTKKNKAALIELDGHETHKTKPQRIIDSIKRNEAAALGIPVVVFTGTQIHSDISACFSSISDIVSV